ncbi:MAG: hypothetical protein U1F76_23555 [Candidatus Competibacteraceae bacterium]
MQEFIQQLTDIIQTALSESVQTVQKFITEDPLISAGVALVVLLGGAAGWYFWNQGE